MGGELAEDFGAWPETLGDGTANRITEERRSDGKSLMRLSR